MIERINLIERDPFKFTYKRIVQIVAGFVIVLVVIFAIQSIRVHLAQKELRTTRQEIQKLEEEKIKLLKTQPKRVLKGPNARLKSTFTEAPEWGKLISDVESRLPSDMWLSSIKASGQQVITTEVKKDGKKETQTTIKPASMVLRGFAKEMKDLWTFYKTLKNSPFVETANLSQTKRVQGNFTFSIECVIIPEKDNK